jgi:predicted nucleic acid-binding protein
MATKLTVKGQVTIPKNVRAALFLAGRAFVKYRRGGRTKTNVPADFFIGAHAAVLGCGILTRDGRRYRTHFPRVALVEPKTRGR